LSNIFNSYRSPYGVDYVKNKKGFCKVKKEIDIANDSITDEDSYKTFSLAWLSAAKDYLSEKNSFYIFNSDRMTFCLKDAMDQYSFRLAQILIWVKNSQIIGM